MREVAVVTDTSSSLTDHTAEQMGITLVPINIQFGRQTFRDGADMTHEEFYHRLIRGEMPKTSQPSPGEFLKVYQRLAEGFRSIVSIHVTGRASGTVQSAHLARQSLPEADISVVDSGLTSMGLGFMALEAARAAMSGATAAEILDLIEDIRPRLDVFAALPTLKYLLRSGRVGKGQGLLAEVLSIRPVLTMQSGLLEAAARVRTYPRALGRMTEMAVARARGEPVRLAVLYTQTLEEAQRFRMSIEGRFNLDGDLPMVEMGPALASHGGPGMMGLAMFRV